VDPRAGLDDVEKKKFLTLPGLELQPVGRPASSQSLYGLSYLGPSIIIIISLLINTTEALCISDFDRGSIYSKVIGM
jgi:hypothetical protein